MKKSTTYNRSEIMRNAWSYVKQHDYTLSAAIKLAWTEAKQPTAQQVMNEVEQLTGTTFYNALLSNGNAIECYFYNDDFIMFENGRYMHSSDMRFGKYEKEANRLGYKNEAELIKGEGTKKVFQINA